MPPRGLTPLCEKVYNGEDDIQDLMEEKDTADEVSRAQNVSSRAAAPTWRETAELGRCTAPHGPAPAHGASCTRA